MGKSHPDSGTPEAPRTLSPEARRWWGIITEAYEMDPPGLLLLQTGLEAFDRMRQGQRRLKRDGIVTTNRFGQKVGHPALLIERDSRNAFLKAIGFLNLELDVAGPPAKAGLRLAGTGR